MKKLLLSLAVVLAAAGLGVGDDAEKDLKKLTGTWEEVSHVADGKAMTADEVKGLTVVIDAAGKWEAFKDGTSIVKGTLEARPGQEAEGGRLGDRGVRHGGQEHLRGGRGHLEALLLPDRAADGVRVEGGQRGALRRAQTGQESSAPSGFGSVRAAHGVERRQRRAGTHE